MLSGLSLTNATKCLKLVRVSSFGNRCKYFFHLNNYLWHGKPKLYKGLNVFFSWEKFLSDVSTRTYVEPCLVPHSVVRWSDGARKRSIELCRFTLVKSKLDDLISGKFFKSCVIKMILFVRNSASTLVEQELVFTGNEEGKVIALKNIMKKVWKADQLEQKGWLWEDKF